MNCPELGGHSIGNVLLCAVGGVEVALDRPRGHDLAALLPDLAERDLAADGRRVAGLLLELAPRHGERLLAGLHLALGDAPGALVLRRPVRAAGMTEQDLDVAGRRRRPRGRR